MKTKLILTFAIISFLAACTDSPEIIAPEPEIPIEPGKPVYMEVLPSIINMQPTRAGVITQFASEDKIGLFITSGELGTNYQDNPEYANMPSTFNGKEWTQKKEIELGKDVATIFAYYPYNQEYKGNGSDVPVEIASQTDYLYSISTGVMNAVPQANLVMKHALSLVSIRIRKNDYQLAGKLTKVEIEGVHDKGTMNIEDGTLSIQNGTTTYTTDCNITLDDSKLEKTSVISMPVSNPSGIKLKVTVDGEVCTYDVPASHVWKPGYEYIYTLNMHKVTGPVNPDDVELDIQYWEKYGKEDNISIGTNTGSMLRISSNFTNFGKETIRGEGKDFGVFVYNYADQPFEGKVRMALFDGERLVEQYQAYNITIPKKRFDGYRIPCYVNCNPGRYQLRALFQEKGKTEWFRPKYSADVEDDDWMYTVKASTELPAIMSLNLEGFPGSSDRVYFVKYNQPFKMQYILTNRARVELHGEIKAVWERTFGEFYDSWENDGITWQDEIGKVRIDVAASSKTQKGEILCTITVDRPRVTRCGPMIHLYYKADGSNEWNLMRNDCDYTLEHLKDVVDAQIWDANNEFLAGGLNFILASYNTVNYTYIQPE